jgi:ribosome maturation protein SDO1
VNVSKGEVAKTGDMQKAFGTSDVKDIIKEVHIDFLIVHFATLNV